MLADKQLMFSESQAIVADAVSTNILDFGAVPASNNPWGNIQAVDNGTGEPMYLEIIIGEAFNTLTSLNIEIQSDDNAGFSSPDVLSLTNKLLAELTLGATIHIPIPNSLVQRYLRLNYDVVGTNPTTGEITAGIPYQCEALGNFLMGAA